MLADWVYILVFLGCIWVLYRLMWVGAPYLPSSDKAIQTIRELADLKSGQRLVDLGSGDGRLLAAFVRDDVYLVGYEINPFLVRRSRQRLAKLVPQNSFQIYRHNFWSADLSSFNVVIVFGSSLIMHRLEAKLKRQLQPGTRVISNGFQFPTWHATRSVAGVHLYLVDRSS